MAIAFTLALALGLQACGGSDDAAPKADPPAKPTTPAKPAPKPTPEPPTEPTAGGEPSGASEGDVVAEGAKSYATFCVSCHGKNGDGDTPFAQALDPPPTKHNDGEYMSTLTDDYLFKVIKEGGAAVGKSPMMAPWGGSLSDEQILAVVAYIRTLPGT